MKLNHNHHPRKMLPHDTVETLLCSVIHKKFHRHKVYRMCSMQNHPSPLSTTKHFPSIRALIVVLLSLNHLVIQLTLQDSLNPNAAILTSLANAVANGQLQPVQNGSPQQQATSGGQVNVTSNNPGTSAQSSTGSSSSPANGNQFVIKFIHNDSRNNISYVNIVPVNYANLHEPRIDLRYNARQPWVNVDERAPNNTVVAAVLVSDPDSGPSGETSLSIEHGNELNHFKLVSTGNSNTIQVNGSPLSRLRQQEYNLLIVARDHGSPPKSSNITLVIKITSNNPLSPIAYNGNNGYNNPPIPVDSLQSTKPPVPTDLLNVGIMLVIVFSIIIFVFITGCAIFQRPKVKKGPPPPRTTSATNLRPIYQPQEQCFDYRTGVSNC